MNEAKQMDLDLVKETKEAYDAIVAALPVSGARMFIFNCMPYCCRPSRQRVVHEVIQPVQEARVRAKSSWPRYVVVLKL